MADRGRPFFRSRRYTPALPKAVQPPDDRTYSAEVTVIQRNLPHHRSARAESPYTRPIMIPSIHPFVKDFFRVFHEVFPLFSVKTENSFFDIPVKRKKAFPFGAMSSTVKEALIHSARASLSVQQPSVGGDAYIAPQEMRVFAPDWVEFGYAQGPLWASAPTEAP